MRIAFLPWCLALVGAMALPARAEDILTVLERSQEQRLESFVAADPDSADARTVAESFGRLIEHLHLAGPVRLKVVRAGSVLAETLQGRIVVASEALARLDEGERLFVLAHELGHVRMRHWAQMGDVYQKYVPGVVAQEQTDAVAGLLGREASGMSHRQEFEADAFGLQVLAALGYGPEVAVGAFIKLGLRADSATHPSTRKRIAQLRQSGPPDALAAQLDDH